jgi:glycerol transport system ATP-binding protein
MNLLPARIEGRRAFVGGSDIALGAAYPSLASTEAVQIGVRPDFAMLTPGNGLKVQMRRIDDYGRKRLAHVTLEGLPMVVTVPDTMVCVGSEVGVTFDTAHVLVYKNDVRVDGVAP